MWFLKRVIYLLIQTSPMNKPTKTHNNYARGWIHKPENCVINQSKAIHKPRNTNKEPHKYHVIYHQNLYKIQSNLRANMKIHKNEISKRGNQSNRTLPIGHGSNGFKRLNQTTFGIRVTILPPPKRRRQEITRGTIGFGDNSG